MKPKKLTLILVTLLLAVSFMTAQEIKGKPTVVIIPFETKNINEDEVEILFEVITNEIAGTGKFKVVDRSSVDKIKEEHKFQNSEWSNDEKIAKLGKALNANMVVTGKIMSNEKDLIVILRMLDVNTMEIVAPATIEVSNILEFLDILPDVVKKLTGEIKSLPKVESASMATDVSILKTQQEEVVLEEILTVHKNDSQDIDFSIFSENIPKIAGLEEVSLEDSRNRKSYIGNITGGTLMLTLGLLFGGASIALTTVSFLQADYYNSLEGIFDEELGFLLMGGFGIPLIIVNIVIACCSAMPFCTASEIKRKYFSVSSTGGYSNKNERLEIAFGYRF